MTNNIRINDKNHTIELTKKFATAAKRFGTPEYEDLQTVRRDYPRYRIEIKSPAKKADCFKGLTIKYMETYIEKKIAVRDNEIKKGNDPEAENEFKAILVSFYLLCGKTEKGEKQEFAATATYGEIKSWFFEQFPELTIQRKTIDEILNKKAA